MPGNNRGPVAIFGPGCVCLLWCPLACARRLACKLVTATATATARAKRSSRHGRAALFVCRRVSALVLAQPRARLTCQKMTSARPLPLELPVQTGEGARRQPVGLIGWPGARARAKTRATRDKARAQTLGASRPRLAEQPAATWRAPLGRPVSSPARPRAPPPADGMPRARPARRQRHPRLISFQTRASGRLDAPTRWRPLPGATRVRRRVARTLAPPPNHLVRSRSSRRLGRARAPLAGY